MMRGLLPPNPNDGVHYPPEQLRTICLAGGCFWGTQAYLARIPGVAETLCVYANGSVPHPTYEQVCSGATGHAEAVRCTYDHLAQPLTGLLELFFRSIDPTVKNRQGNDIGSQYRTGIYYTAPEDLPVIRAVVAREQPYHDKPIVTEVLPLQCDYPAEDYHQNYLEKNPGGYCHVDFGHLQQ